ncbi:MAG: hypothetical protein K6E21_01150 [Bacilli bacterium]|nr:hypothetical protein [Bacilli bacterium]
MKKYYIILSILITLIIACAVFSIFKFIDYKDITEDIVGQEITFAFTSALPGLSGDTPKERPDTSALQAKADTSLALGISFSVIGGICIIAFVLLLIKTLKLRNNKANEQ